MANPRVVLVGGGFGGLYAAFALHRQPVDVTLIDRNNYHLFQPFLYQVATAGLSPGDIGQPIRYILRRSPNTRVRMAEVREVDLAHRVVRLADGELAYDALLLAPGAVTSYFGHPEWTGVAPGLKDIEDALEIRRRILTAFERAEQEPDEEKRRELLTFVVVGAGPTGVELAGSLHEIAFAVRKEFRTIEAGKARIVLLEAGARLLPGFDPRLVARAHDALTRRCIEVRTGSPVTGLAAGEVQTPTGPIRAGTVLWAAGVRGAPLLQTLGVPLDRTGRVAVEPDLSIPGHPEVFVIGDAATFLHQPGREGRPLPGMAPVAIQMGRHAAGNILRRTRSESTLPFRYRPKGAMATVGRHFAIAEVGPLRLHGLAGWLVWLVAHILFLIGFRNKVLVLIEWTWAYLTFNRGVRLITREGTPSRP